MKHKTGIRINKTAWLCVWGVWISILYLSTQKDLRDSMGESRLRAPAALAGFLSASVFIKKMKGTINVCTELTTATRILELLYLGGFKGSSVEAIWGDEPSLPNGT